MWLRRRTPSSPPPPPTEEILREIDLRLAEVGMLSRRLAAKAAHAARTADEEGAGERRPDTD